MRFALTLNARVLAALIAIVLGTSMAMVTVALAETRQEYRTRIGTQFAAWVQELRREVLAQGIDGKTFDAAFAGVTLDWDLPDLVPPGAQDGGPVAADDRQQPEFSQPFRYFPENTLNGLVRAGRTRLERHRSVLARIEETYGVQAEILVALWARETSYGRVRIPHYAIRALATQSFMGRRTDFFRPHLIDALRILQEGHISRDKMWSSWAGAMGHTQMMPGKFHEHAVDFDGDGRRDIWGTIGDALASTAQSLKRYGWRPGETWGYEIELPADFDCALEGPDKGRPIGEWVEMGLARTFGRTFPEERLQQTGFLLLPAGRYGPAFIALENFYVLKKYNTSDLYALYIGHLADRYLNNRRFANRWRRVSAFKRSDVRAFQERLIARGLDPGGADGLIGFRTRVATGLYQKSNGLRQTCYPSPELMAHAREADAAGQDR